MNAVTIKLRLHAVMIVSTLVCQFAHADSQKIIKWIDNHGVTHYGEKPPMPDEISNQSSVLNKHGVIIKKTIIEKEKATTSAKEGKQSADQKRYDRALLSSYTSIEEIELARKRNVRIDKLALEDLQQRRKRILESTEQFDKITLQKIEAQIHKQQTVIDNINQRYENDKKRFNELTAKNNQ